MCGYRRMDVGWGFAPLRPPIDVYGRPLRSRVPAPCVLRPAVAWMLGGASPPSAPCLRRYKLLSHCLSLSSFIKSFTIRPLALPCAAACSSSHAAFSSSILNDHIFCVVTPRVLALRAVAVLFFSFFISSRFYGGWLSPPARCFFNYLYNSVSSTHLRNCNSP